MIRSNSMRLAGFVSVLAATAASTGALALSAAANPPAAQSSACTRAKIGGQWRCLAVGQRCQRRYERQYEAKGFLCVRKNGVYRLKRQSMTF
jgi:uncharacterized membrane protein